MKKKIILILSIILALGTTIFFFFPENVPSPVAAITSEIRGDIKWVDFNVPYSALDKALKTDILSNEQEVHLSWIDALAYLGAKYGGDFSSYKASDLDKLFSRIQEGESICDITADMKYFNYYQQAYGAVLSGFVGEYEVEVPATDAAVSNTDLSSDGEIGSEEHSDIQQNNKQYECRYGLKAFSPIASGFWYNDFDDFGAGRSYGYKRKHLGHDLMVSTGTPVIAVESGIVEALGWNQYGGWRIGIRSYDGLRYYYYAHLRKGHPYASGLSVGSTVCAGDVIGFSGQTGYSAKEDTNNIDTPHLHFGMQLIFDESKKDSPTQIWIDLYSITKLLSRHQSEVEKDDETGEYVRKYAFKEANYYQKEQQKQNSLDILRINNIIKNIRDSRDNTVDTVMDVNADNIQFPILMYHGLIKDTRRQTKYFISPELFEDDLQYIQENGYTTIVMEDLFNYVEKGVPLPEKPIMLTFDDGYYNNYVYAYPLLREYEEKAVISVIGKLSDDFTNTVDPNPYYAHLTWSDMEEMMHSGVIEFQNHTYNLHKNKNGRVGVAQTYHEEYNHYLSFLKKDVGLLQLRFEDNLGFRPRCFTYPFGSFSDDTDDALKELGFKATLSCQEGMNSISQDPNDLFKLKRYLRPPKTSAKEFFEKIEKDRKEEQSSPQ